MQTYAARKELPTLNGWKYLATHQASVDAILGAGVRKVYSRGRQFRNIDKWTDRAFLDSFCAWVTKNEGKKPERADYQGMLQDSVKNSDEWIRFIGPHILI